MNSLRWIVVGVAALLGACAPRGTVTRQVVAELLDPESRPVGRAYFTEEDDGVRIEFILHGLPPGSHAVHIHEGSECAPPEFESAGGHFNPFDKEHGLNNPKGPHAGDLPNIQIAEDGTYRGTVSAKLVTLRSGANSLLRGGGTSIVIHASPDDHRSQPSGNSGARIACGRIGEYAGTE
jgi:Cu-Zn family superoxide dismutase